MPKGACKVVLKEAARNIRWIKNRRPRGIICLRERKKIKGKKKIPAQLRTNGNA